MEELLKYKLENGAFYHTDADIWIKSNIQHVDEVKDDFDNVVGLNIELENGSMNINRYSKVKKVLKPSETVLDFKWCFAIKNQFGLKIGYIGELKTI